MFFNCNLPALIVKQWLDWSSHGCKWLGGIWILILKGWKMADVEYAQRTVNIYKDIADYEGNFMSRLVCLSPANHNFTAIWGSLAVRKHIMISLPDANIVLIYFNHMLCLKYFNAVYRFSCSMTQLATQSSWRNFTSPDLLIPLWPWNEAKKYPRFRVWLKLRKASKSSNQEMNASALEENQPQFTTSSAAKNIIARCFVWFQSHVKHTNICVWILKLN